MYVALTRAIHGLEIIIAPSKASERSVPLTNAGLIRAALTDQQPLPPDSEVFAIGDEHWWRQLTTRLTPERPPERFIESIRLAGRALRCIADLKLRNRRALKAKASFDWAID